ncbi:ATP-binding cassette domain-containing protein [Sphingomonas morindae]|uniref:ATP-binding cassette domain-containing protein n=1 Tax=Sphingomonas morindae TaxID=1541170 RepID=A0ABY4XDT3_9SPHN|nr:ABC-F family ATP-binding cassette domain-containing protein [Sphingomonas morindae]USI75057.1 ATP-binding cassette domain-containing protein [Sphingomonas morindae]
MPAITAIDLGWSTADGHPVFSHLNLSFCAERVGIVGRNGVGKTSLLRLLSGDRAPTAGRIIIDGTVAVLRQIVQVGAEDTIADLFGIADQLSVLRRAEAGLATESELAEADWTLEMRLVTALARTGLNADGATRLASLSGGERTRAALASAMFAQPDFLLLDEPTNNLDRGGRAALLDLLASWSGGAIIVSHDRELLERMDAIVELTSLGARRYGGNWSQYRARKAIERASAHHDLEVAQRQLGDIQRKAQQGVERKLRRDAAGSRKGARGDMPRILAGARKQRAENSGGEHARLAERQRSQAMAAAASAGERIERLETMMVSLASSGLAHGAAVLRLDKVTAGYCPDAPVLRDVSLSMTGPERVALIGPNGSGKTILLSVIAGRIVPWSGTVRHVERLAMLDQTAAMLDPALSVAENYQRINPGSDDFACRSALAQFRFKADAALKPVGALSGGEMLRAGLACTLASPLPPQLLILDEPTNHLDLDSIAAIEAALAAYDGALLVVSHDAAFLDAIGVTRYIDLAT